MDSPLTVAGAAADSTRDASSLRSLLIPVRGTIGVRAYGRKSRAVKAVQKRSVPLNSDWALPESIKAHVPGHGIGQRFDRREPARIVIDPQDIVLSRPAQQRLACIG